MPLVAMALVTGAAIAANAAMWHSVFLELKLFKMLSPRAISA
jgi:hypothetical protein